MYICSLSSNQITLDAGTYECRISAPAFEVERHQAKLRNVTDNSDVMIGTSAFAHDAGYVHIRSFISGKFTIASSKALEVQHRCTDTDSFGLDCNFGVNEVYTVAEFWKVG
jgi:hypothetical protein